MTRNTSGGAFGILKVIHKFLIQAPEEILVVFGTGLVEECILNQEVTREIEEEEGKKPKNILVIQCLLNLVRPIVIALVQKSVF